MRTSVAALAAALVTTASGAALVGVGPAAAGPGTAPGTVDPVAEPAPDTVVRVDGDAENGFAIHHYDGTSLHPPTLSESMAECGEYDTDVQVAVCEAETRTWFRDLAVLQAALDWAHAAPR